MIRTAVVTGAAGSIGLGAVEKLLEDKRRVVMVDKDAARLRIAAGQLGQNVLMVAADLASEDAPVVVGRAIESHGWEPAAIVINNAGISPKHNGCAHDALEVTLSEWELTLRTNVTALLLMARQFLPYMKDQGWGRIVNISSRAGRYNPNQAGPAYVTSKAAVLGLTRSLASDFSRYGITCNAIAPGFVESALTKQLRPEQLDSLVQRTPVGRGGTPREIGSAIAYLTSDEAAFITGACLDVNGGQSMA